MPFARLRKRLSEKPLPSGSGGVTPFENLDVVLGRGVRVDLESLQDKLVTGGRGGYRHEHNLLFAAALERLGFRVRRHLARIRLGRGHLPRTHATLTVEADGGWWLADVGFGGDGLVEPVPFSDGASARLGERARRLGRDGGFWVLHARGEGRPARSSCTPSGRTSRSTRGTSRPPTSTWRSSRARRSATTWSSSAPRRPRGSASRT